MINNITLMGRLTATPELKSTPNGVSVTPFTMAVDRKYTPTGQERQTDFIDCVAWRNTAEFISKYFKKGEMIAVEGELQTRNFEDKHGNKRKAVEVVVSSASFCESKQAGKSSVEINEDDPTNGFVVVDDLDGDLPF